jgi:hypothetical protein
MSNNTQDAEVSEFLRSLSAGDEVTWTDPDEGISSGTYKIGIIVTESGSIESDDTIVTLYNEEGSEVEAFASELS